MNHKIVKRKYIAVTMKLISPLAVSSGESLYSDADVQRNGDGEVFVPGTSLAGAFRNILEDYGCYETVMGSPAGSEGHMSPLYISDFYFEGRKQGNITVSVRDRVKLNGGKTVDNKFDTEIVEPEIKGTLFLNYVQRQKDKTEGEADYDGAVVKILKGIQSGDIRIGSNKNRGFGRFRILKVYEKEFDKNMVNDWISFVPCSKDCSAYGEGISFKDWTTLTCEAKTEGEPDYESGYLKIQVPLHLAGGISIRKYSNIPEMPDFEHITCGVDEDGESIPVIPGTSWGGALRAGALSILTDLIGKKKAICHIRNWFGYVRDKSERKAGGLNAWQSSVVIGESRLRGGVWKTVTRNQINRFDFSTKTGSLFSERTYFGGDTMLELMVRKEKCYEALVGLLLLVIYELQEGYVCVGGETAAGRGIFEKNDEIIIDYGGAEKKDALEKVYNKALYRYLYEGGADK